MTDVKDLSLTGGKYPVKWLDNGDGTYSLAIGSATGIVTHVIVDSVPAADLDSDGTASADTLNALSKYLGNGLGFTTLTPKYAKVSCSSSGVNIIVAAVTSKQIIPVRWDVTVAAAVNFKWQSHTTPTDLTGLYYCAAAGAGVEAPYCPVGHFASVAGESLDLNLSGAIAVGGSVTYVEF